MLIRQNLPHASILGKNCVNKLPERVELCTFIHITKTNYHVQNYTILFYKFNWQN